MATSTTTNTLPSLMHFPLAVRVLVQSYHTYGRSIAIRRAIWDDAYPHAEVTPETKWLTYDGGLFFIIDDDGQRLAQNSDVTEEDFLAWDWTTLPPGCLSDPTITCGAADPLDAFTVHPYNSNEEITYAAFDIQNPNGWLSPCAQACSPISAPPGVGGPEPAGPEIDLGSLPGSDNSSTGGGGSSDGGGGGDQTGGGGGDQALPGGGGGGGAPGGGGGGGNDGDGGGKPARGNKRPIERPTLTFDTVTDGGSPTADGPGGACTTTNSTSSVAHGGGTLALSDDGTGNVWQWKLRWMGEVVETGTIGVGATASFGALPLISMSPGVNGSGRSWTLYAYAYLPGDSGKPIEAQHMFWYPPICEYIGS